MRLRPRMGHRAPRPCSLSCAAFAIKATRCAAAWRAHADSAARLLPGCRRVRRGRSRCRGPRQAARDPLDQLDLAGGSAIIRPGRSPREVARPVHRAATRADDPRRGRCDPSRYVSARPTPSHAVSARGGGPIGLVDRHIVGRHLMSLLLCEDMDTVLQPVRYCIAHLTRSSKSVDRNRTCRARSLANRRCSRGDRMKVRGRALGAEADALCCSSNLVDVLGDARLRARRDARGRALWTYAQRLRTPGGPFARDFAPGFRTLRALILCQRVWWPWRAPCRAPGLSHMLLGPLHGATALGRATRARLTRTVRPRVRVAAQGDAGMAVEQRPIQGAQEARRTRCCRTARARPHPRCPPRAAQHAAPRLAGVQASRSARSAPA